MFVTLVAAAAIHQRLIKFACTKSNYWSETPDETIKKFKVFDGLCIPSNETASTLDPCLLLLASTFCASYLKYFNESY